MLVRMNCIGINKYLKIILRNFDFIDCDSFDIIEYIKFYCNQDVNILKHCFQKFREICYSELHQNVVNVLTSPSLANNYFTTEIYEKINNYYIYTSVPRVFI